MMKQTKVCRCRLISAARCSSLSFLRGSRPQPINEHGAHGARGSAPSYDEHFPRQTITTSRNKGADAWRVAQKSGTRRRADCRARKGTRCTGCAQFTLSCWLSLVFINCQRSLTAMWMDA
eukprot:6208567-Pleurochrysis_carterae.AAC.3